MSSTALHTPGLLLITVPTIELGGMALLKFPTRGSPGYADNPLRRAMFRAGHAHAGVRVVFALVGLLYLGSADLCAGARGLTRAGLIVAPILMPAGFFLSVTSAATRSNKLVRLVYAGAAALAGATVTLGIGLLSV